jgi:hypothetical protein
MIRRREFIAGLGSAAAWPLVARELGGRSTKPAAVVCVHSRPDWVKGCGKARGAFFRLGCGYVNRHDAPPFP